MDEDAYRKAAQQARDRANELTKQAEDLRRVESADVAALEGEIGHHPDQADYWRQQASQRQQEIDSQADDLLRKAGDHQREAEEYDRKAAAAHEEEERRKDRLKRNIIGRIISGR